MEKCEYCDREKLCGVGRDATPVCRDHFEEYLQRIKNIFKKSSTNSEEEESTTN